MTEILDIGADTTQIVSGLITIGIAVATVTGINALLFRRTRRLSKNLRRPLAVIPSRRYDMSSEARLLKSTGFFKGIEVFSADGRSVDSITEDFRLAILRYEADSDFFWHTYESLRAKRIPVIVYTQADGIDRTTDHMKRIQEYTFNSVCNTPTRMLSDVWAIMATYPEASK